MKEICIINKGDNLKKIAMDYGLTIDNVSNINLDSDWHFQYIDLNNNTDEITLVKNYNCVYLRKIRDGEGVLDVYASGLEPFADSSIIQGEMAVLSKPQGFRYSVKPLDTLEKIAKTYGVLEDDIIQKNGLTSNKIFVGQILLI
ncbi:MAG: LysM peptidoglycan-binding domain-containing protein [Clostridia bacterium]|nr:LysM peptidoglycan-binding domain-containing protein [Clostridia bacterium]